MDNLRFDHFLALLNFVIFLFQVMIRAEIKRLDEKLEYLEERVKSLEKCVWSKKND
jgi:hypothetical protein